MQVVTPGRASSLAAPIGLPHRLHDFTAACFVAIRHLASFAG
jgi:hypothetical protein